MKKVMLIFAITLLLISSNTSPTHAEQLLVIAHPDINIDKIDLEQLKQLYLGKITSIKNVQINLVDCSEYHEAFLNKVVGKTTRNYHKLWVRNLFAEGASPPVQMNTKNNVISYVLKNKNTIAYVPQGSDISKNVKILLSGI